MILVEVAFDLKPSLFCCITEVRELQRHLEDDEVGMILPKKWGGDGFQKGNKLWWLGGDFILFSIFLIGEMIQFYFLTIFFNGNRRYAGPNAGFHTVHLLTHKKICGPRPSRLEKEMFLLPDASGGSNSRVFVVPPWCPARDAMAAESMDGTMLGSFAIPKTVRILAIYFFQTSKGNADD